MHLFLQSKLKALLKWFWVEVNAEAKSAPICPFYVGIIKQCLNFLKWLKNKARQHTTTTPGNAALPFRWYFNSQVLLSFFDLVVFCIYSPVFFIHFGSRVCVSPYSYSWIIFSFHFLCILRVKKNVIPVLSAALTLGVAWLDCCSRSNRVHNLRDL